MNSRELKIIKTEDGSHSLYVPELKETYHSFHGAVQESRHVFIEAGLAYFSELKTPQEISLLEIGFGTGLNALLAAEWAMKEELIVEMHSLEAFPVDLEIALSLNYTDRIRHENAQSWFERMHRESWGLLQPIHEFFSLNKIHSQVEDYTFDRTFDVVFFDAFAPNKQPELWEMPILKKVYDTLKTQGVFVTYCAKGQLKRDLKSLGFEVETLPGPPGKKEMVRGIKK